MASDTKGWSQILNAAISGGLAEAVCYPLRNILDSKKHGLRFLFGMGGYSVARELCRDSELASVGFATKCFIGAGSGALAELTSVRLRLGFGLRGNSTLLQIGALRGLGQLAFYFEAKEVIARQLHDDPERPTFFTTLGAASCASFANALFLCPVARVLKEVNSRGAESWVGGKVPTLFDGFVRKVRADGAFSLYKGITTFHARSSFPLILSLVLFDNFLPRCSSAIGMLR